MGIELLIEFYNLSNIDIIAENYSQMIGNMPELLLPFIIAAN